MGHEDVYKNPEYTFDTVCRAMYDYERHTGKSPNRIRAGVNVFYQLSRHSSFICYSDGRYSVAGVWIEYHEDLDRNFFIVE